MRKLQGAVVGLGYWGPNIVRNFLKISEVQIKLACDTSSEMLTKFKKEYPYIATTTTYDEILKDPTIDFVAIATPLKTHYLLARKALLADKHVLVEKPMTQTSKEAKALVALAKKKKKMIMVGHTFIYSDAVQKIKKIISKKQFGTFLYFDSTRINLGRLQADANVVWDLAPHDLSILSYLLPEDPISIQAMGSSHISKNNSEIAHIFLTYNTNITAHIHVSWLSPVKIRSILIGGSKQMILYNDIEPSEKVRVYNKSVSLSPEEITPFSPAYRSGSVFIPPISQTEAVYNQLSHFVDCIKRKTPPITDANEGLKVVRLLEMIDKAMQKNTRIILHEKTK